MASCMLCWLRPYLALCCSKIYHKKINLQHENQIKLLIRAKTIFEQLKKIHVRISENYLQQNRCLPLLIAFIRFSLLQSYLLTLTQLRRLLSTAIYTSYPPIIGVLLQARTLLCFELHFNSSETEMSLFEFEYFCLKKYCRCTGLSIKETFSITYLSLLLGVCLFLTYMRFFETSIRLEKLHSIFVQWAFASGHAQFLPWTYLRTSFASFECQTFLKLQLALRKFPIGLSYPRIQHGQISPNGVIWQEA